MSRDNALTAEGLARARGAFLVGCPRSGTTLLQLRLARHPEILTFPESHFFDRALGGRSRVRRILGLPGRQARANLDAFASAVDPSGVAAGVVRRASTLQGMTREFVGMMDVLASRQRAMWLEKTPGHSHYIDYIRRNVDGARFVHLIRSGPEVVESLYRVTRQYPEHWSGVWDIEQCVARWVSAIRDSSQWCDDDAHFVLFLEDFIERPRICLEQLLTFLGCGIDQGILDEMVASGDGSRENILAFEAWKDGSAGAIRDRANAGDNSILSPRERQLVESRLASLDLSDLQAAAARRLSAAHHA